MTGASSHPTPCAVRLNATDPLNVLLAALSTPGGAPVIVATRLRKGSANSARGAARLVADALRTGRACGASGLLVVRADSAFYGRDVVAAITRTKAQFSITARQDVAVKRAIAAIGADAWTAIRYPRAVFDEQLGQWVSDAQIAEVPFTAFASRGRKHAITARLVVRRVRDANPDHLVPNEQGELFPAWRHQLSRPGARCRCCRRSVSPGRSPNPPCGSLRNGLSTVSAVRCGGAGARGWGSCCRGSGSG